MKRELIELTKDVIWDNILKSSFPPKIKMWLLDALENSNELDGFRFELKFLIKKLDDLDDLLKEAYKDNFHSISCECPQCLEDEKQEQI